MIFSGARLQRQQLNDYQFLEIQSTICRSPTHRQLAELVLELVERKFTSTPAEL